jgi:hypothetical protein
MKTAAILLAALVLAACVNATLGPASLRLQQGMTESQAIAAIGSNPNRAEVRTCGSTSGNPWTCRVLYYGSPPHTLNVYFSQNDGTWVVNNWSVY